MEYDLSDSSGTDDDLPPPHQNRFARNARVAGNGRSTVGGSGLYPRVHNNEMETQIHMIEQEAYYSILRAFKAQSDALSWEKESLITELRRELRVSDEQHREHLQRVNNDDMIHRIREWRKAHGLQPGVRSSSQPVHEPVPSPTVSASRKKQKTSQSMASLSVGAPSPAMHPNMQPSSSTLKRGPPPGGRGKKTKPSVQYPSTALAGRPEVANRGAPGAFPANDPAEAANYNLVGKKVWTRWPDDNNFYEALISDYVEGLHVLVYEMHTPREQYEYVNLKEIPPEDIRWEGEHPGNSHIVSRAGQGRGLKKTSGRGGAVHGAGRGRGTLKGQPKKDLLLPQNGIGRKASGDIVELLHTDTLIKEVEKVFSAIHPNPAEVEKAKKVLKEHEQALVDAIARLEDASDGESDGRDPHLSQGQPMDREKGWRKPQHNEVGEGRGAEGLDGDKARVGSEKQAS